jgi:hypothetical protein
MKTLLLKTAFVFILFSGFLSSAFGQYKYLGIEVYDIISPGNYETYIPIDSNSTFALVMDTLNVLDERERIIIEDYFGLVGNTRTLEDIGGDFNLTKERVRQIKEKSLRKLRDQSLELFEYI